MAATAQKYDAEGTMIGTVDLPEALFGCEPHGAALHAYTKVCRTNQRQGTVKTKTRAEVSGGGAKPWRQKGTGRARAGSNSSPVWVGGGRAFGPRVRHHRERLPRKVGRLALLSALSLKARNGAVCVWERKELEAPKTKAVVTALQKMGMIGCETLLLDEGIFPNLAMSCRNVSWLTRRRADLANAYQVMRAHSLVVTPEGLKRMTEVFGS
jgi:large subunit ribosomal protein L4